MEITKKLKTKRKLASNETSVAENTGLIVTRRRRMGQAKARPRLTHHPPGQPTKGLCPINNCES